MVKAKFQDDAGSKTDVAMANEVLAKILCHNIDVCVREMFALGTEVDFGRSAVEPEVDGDELLIIRFPGA